MLASSWYNSSTLITVQDRDMTDDCQELTTRIDYDSSASYVYYGEALPGTSATKASWRISRKTVASGSVLYAGDGDFDQAWSSRTTLTYA